LFAERQFCMMARRRKTSLDRNIDINRHEHTI
jgi:hypothetical protein